MIKTECLRYLLDNSTDYPLPSDVQKSLDEWNRTRPVKLALYFDEHSTFSWQVYQVKKTGAVAKDDTLHWQMTVPIKGTSITSGIFDWIKKYDTSQGGYLDRDDLKKQWLKHWKIGEEKQKKVKDSRQDCIYNETGWLIKKLAGLREQIVVPQTVGYSPKGGPIRAVPKGTAKKMKRSKQKVRAANGN